MALSEETESNGENKPAPKGREAHFYSTVYIMKLLDIFGVITYILHLIREVEQCFLLSFQLSKMMMIDLL